MKALIFSCGRTGTNMLLEILRGSSVLHATSPAEDKRVFRNPTVLHNNYLSKCDTVYADSLEQVLNMMTINPDLKLLWTIRDLRDSALSKIYRGQPGNDVGALPADDATFTGCIDDIDWMYKLYCGVKSKFPDRLMLVKMENVILNFEETISQVCNFLEIEFEDNMNNFTNRYRVSHKANRYKKLDNKQVGLWKRRNEIYGGFFKTHNIDLDSLFDKLGKYQKEFGYE